MLPKRNEMKETVPSEKAELVTPRNEYSMKPSWRSAIIMKVSIREDAIPEATRCSVRNIKAVNLYRKGNQAKWRLLE